MDDDFVDQTFYVRETTECVEYEIVDADHSPSVLLQQQNNEWCDVVLFGKDSLVGFKGHKMILASASPHLRDAFKSKGFIDSNAKEYHVEQIDYATLKVIVDFIYSGTLRLTGGDIRCIGGIGGRVESVLIGADYLRMPGLVDVCGKGLSDPPYLYIDSAVDMWLFAREYNCKVLEEAAVGTMASALNDVAEQVEFLSLEKKDVVALLKFLVAAASTDLVCGAAIAWLGYTRTDRRANCDEVMRQVPLNAVSVKGLQRASESAFLSEVVKWAIQQVQVVKQSSGNLSPIYPPFPANIYTGRFDNF